MSDDEPTGEEAEAQREETVMPWFWLGVGLIAIVAFILALSVGISHVKPAKDQVAPAENAVRRGVR